MKTFVNVKYILLSLLLAAFVGCRVQTGGGDGLELPELRVQTESFKEYWYSGKAELAHYDLQQIRYGEVRDGSAMLVFVTEDFLLDKQVKLESPADGRAVATVLKLNLLKEFVTGIYTYNVMTSVFTPIDLYDHPNTLKVASSSQEWCGTTYAQLNLRGGQYEVTGHSYFEEEADYRARLDNTWLEDELWTKLRLSPDLLPEGEVNIIPGSFEVRSSHSGWSVETADARKAKWEGEDVFPGENLMAYELDYRDADRTLTIIYEPVSPYRIAGWIETQQGRNGETLSARSVRTDVIQEPYWQQNAKADEELRKKLGLED